MSRGRLKIIKRPQFVSLIYDNLIMESNIWNKMLSRYISCKRRKDVCWEMFNIIVLGCNLSFDIFTLFFNF